ncbi:MAG: Asp-tRNA(Asn)/Glu-tRNA(Gln) amidotransferase subunit GatB, partial [Deltaproteobacteria bacterium]|nr:Asp-tRNA(Asn)/Glu-tRNA(Gln) amidotransferase subunit GatB [Deltaproteobacteria bacterium]
GLVDFNRAGVPLLEIVTDHARNPLHSVREAQAYLEKLIQILRYIGVSECRIEKGQFRCDVNISMRPAGSPSFGRRAEIKNMASFKSISDAIEYEIKRQSRILRSGGRVSQETRLFDSEKGVTRPMRTKENAPDYRYFPDPDLVEVECDSAFVAALRAEMPELPDRRVKRLVAEYGIAEKDVLILTRDREVSEYFGACAALCCDPKRLARWIIGELFRLLNESSLPIRECPVNPENFSRLVDLISRAEIPDPLGRALLQEMYRTGEPPEAALARTGWRPLTDPRMLGEILDEVMEENPEAVAQLNGGKARTMDYIIGRVMKRTGGRADPRKVRELLQEKFRGDC